MPVSFWTPWSLRLGGLAAQAAMRPPFGPMLHPSEWRIRALGLSTAVGHPVFHLVWTYWLPQPYENPWERAAVATLGLVLLLAPGLHQQPPSRAAVWLFSAIAWLTLPVYFTWMYLCNDRNTIWLASLCMVILIYDHLSDWRVATLGWLVAMPVAWGLFTTFGPATRPLTFEQAATQWILLAFAWYMGLILGISAQNLRSEQLRQALGTMGIMAHELRTPLATMSLVGDAVRQQSTTPAPDPALLLELSRRLNAVVAHMNHQIDTQIANARLMHLRPRHDPVPVAAVVRSRIAGYPFRSAHERDCVQVHVIKEFAFLGAPDLFGQLVENLVKNALRSLAAMPDPPRPGDLRIEVDRKGRHGRVSVIDRGTGLDPLLRKRLFQPFVSSHQGSSHGLGLAFCLRVVRASGGQIRVESEPGQGARFHIELPVLATPSP